MAESDVTWGGSRVVVAVVAAVAVAVAEAAATTAANNPTPRHSATEVTGCRPAPA